MTLTDVVCSRCHVRCLADGISTGYGTTADGRKLCFGCCGQIDKERLAHEGRGSLYLTEIPGHATLSNWPGTFRLPVGRIAKGKHNIAGERTDVWFHFAGREWHGVTYGSNTQICHVKALKEAR